VLKSIVLGRILINRNWSIREQSVLQNSGRLGIQSELSFLPANLFSHVIIKYNLHTCFFIELRIIANFAIFLETLDFDALLYAKAGLK